jgi:CubicO group peptidase (beta-lactamase class C family)
MQLIAPAVLSVTVLLSLVSGTIAASCSPSRPFPTPLYSTLSLQEVFNQISDTLSDYFADPAFDATNVAIEVTSSQETLWSFYHAAENQSSQVGTSAIGTDTVFRVARVSKLFTAIAVLQLHDQGHIASLHDPVKNYILDLEPSKVEWGRISIWDLLNNMAGILDMCSYILLLRRRCTNADKFFLRWICRYPHRLHKSSES